MIVERDAGNEANLQLLLLVLGTGKDTLLCASVSILSALYAFKFTCKPKACQLLLILC